MGLRKLREIRVEKLKNSMVNIRSGKMKMMLIRAMMTVLLCICLVQLTALGGSLGPRVLKGWPACFTQDSHSAAALDVKLLHVHARVLPHKRTTSEYLQPKQVWTGRQDSPSKQTLNRPIHETIGPFKYGINLENRFWLPFEVMQAISDEIGSGVLNPHCLGVLWPIH